jgi:hypothetical protein
VGDWSRVQQQLGAALPDDYRALVTTYGLGCFAKCFLAIYHPFARNPHLNLVAQRDVVVNSNVSFWEMESKSDPGPMARFSFRWSREEVLPVGGTENGDYVFWIRHGLPNEWTIGVLGRSGFSDEETQTYPYGLVEFLRLWLSNELDVAAFPRKQVFRGRAVPATFRAMPDERID